MNFKSDFLKNINIFSAKHTVKIRNAFINDFCKFNINKIVEAMPRSIWNKKFKFSNPIDQIFSLINRVNIIQNKKVNEVATDAPTTL